MKKKSEISYIFIFIISFILANVFLGSKYGVYDFLPNYHLFEMPDDPSGGNIFHEFFRWNLSFIFAFLITFIITSVNKNLKFSLLKEIQNGIKKNDYSVFYIILGFTIFFPLVSLFADYINLSIGIPTKDILHFKSKSEILFPFVQWALFIILLIFIFYNIIKKK
tara:strand:+ start:66 stop:560 length:495 start_codon:yes stop_codon:yes gene_type:complete